MVRKSLPMIIGKTTLAGVGSVRRKAMMPATKPWSCGGASRSQAGFAVEMNSGGQAQRNLLPGGRAGLVALADVLVEGAARAGEADAQAPTTDTPSALTMAVPE
jgi:hypothetical protein